MFHDKKRSSKDCDSTHKTAIYAAMLHYTKNKNRNACIQEAHVNRKYASAWSAKNAYGMVPHMCL